MYRTHLQTQDRRLIAGGPKANLHRLLVPLLAFWLLTVAAFGQCQSVLQSGGPIATLRGRVLCSVPWDPDGTGPLGTWLAVGGLHLTRGDQMTPVGLLAHDGARWRGVGFDVDQEVRALAVFNGELVAGGSSMCAATSMRFAARPWEPTTSPQAPVTANDRRRPREPASSAAPASTT